MIELFEITIEQPEDIFIEGTGRGDILVSQNGRGEFCGEKMNGKLIPGGHCLTYSPDKSINRVVTPLLLETDDETKILMHLDADLHLPQEVEKRFLKGEKVSPEEYYFKGNVRFDVGNQKYKWLENKNYFCSGKIEKWSNLRFKVYSLK